MGASSILNELGRRRVKLFQGLESDGDTVVLTVPMWAFCLFCFLFVSFLPQPVFAPLSPSITEDMRSNSLRIAWYTKVLSTDCAMKTRWSGLSPGGKHVSLCDGVSWAIRGLKLDISFFPGCFQMKLDLSNLAWLPALSFACLYNFWFPACGVGQMHKRRPPLLRSRTVKDSLFLNIG